MADSFNLQQLHTEECFRKMAQKAGKPAKRTIHKLRHSRFIIHF